MFNINLRSLDFEKETDEHHIFDSAKAITNCYLSMLLLLIYQVL